jgi:hypothetical protein
VHKRGFQGYDGSQQTPFFRGLLPSASIESCLRTRRPQVRVLQGALLFEWRGPLHPAKLGHSWGPDAPLRFVALLIPYRTVAYNNRISGERTIGAVSLILIKVATRRLGGTVVTRTPDGGREEWSSRVRTLVDAVYDWARFDTLPRGFGWIRQELRAGRVTAFGTATCSAPRCRSPHKGLQLIRPRRHNERSFAPEVQRWPDQDDQ